MKTVNYFLLLTTALITVDSLAATVAVLEHGGMTNGITNPSCTENLKIRYNYGSNPTNSWGLNPYRITAKLLKNGSVVGNYSNGNSSSAWSNFPIYNMGVSQGTYQAQIKFEKRTLTGWQTVETVFTNTLVANVPPANPLFNINGIPPATNQSNPITVCKSFIRVNATDTSCETKYALTVEESDQWWTRTYKYEWSSLWISGQAPGNIDLQQKSVQYSSSPATYLGSDSSRMGEQLKGGLLYNGQERYYRVSVCTGEPSWTCKSALIKVDDSC